MCRRHNVKKNWWATKSLKKTPSKVSTRKKNSYQFFPLNTVEIAQLEEVILQNVACRPTVYETGLRGGLSMVITRQFHDFFFTICQC